MSWFKPNQVDIFRNGFIDATKDVLDLNFYRSIMTFRTLTEDERGILSKILYRLYLEEAPRKAEELGFKNFYTGR